jgi:site-specific DNA recombinase
MGRRNTFLKTLNGGGVPSPQPQRGRVSRSWCPSSVRTILRNERYRGLVVWGRTRRYARQKLAGVFIVLAQRTNGYIPAQRIVSEELWHRVHERRDLVKRAYIAAQKPKGLLNSAALNSSYLFSGLLKCGECGANLTVLWGAGRNKSSQVYGCPSNWNRGETVCKNTTRIRRDDLESSMLANLQEKILRSDVVDYVMERVESGLLKELEDMGNEMSRMEDRKRELVGELANLTKALASGQFSPTIMTAIAEREKEIEAITDRVVSSSEDSIKKRVASMTVSAKAKLKDLRGLLSGDITVARAALLKHVERIEMEASGKTYVAKGNWSLLGDRAWDGAGGQNRTGYARLFRAALYQ